MRDKDFLKWIYYRLKEVHGENPDYDYMFKLRNIIIATPPDVVTPNVSRATEDMMEKGIIDADRIVEHGERVTPDIILGG